VLFTQLRRVLILRTRVNSPCPVHEISPRGIMVAIGAEEP
jgi:hypothetical protein